mmetsp:Transcript_18784/g.54480  ORF Transcript_18784/g.54480 Transcript_18784/m.54480 type:complete len:209 (+) Transcript_18784:550-1176(+)
MVQCLSRSSPCRRKCRRRHRRRHRHRHRRLRASGLTVAPQVAAGAVAAAEYRALGPARLAVGVVRAGVRGRLLPPSPAVSAVPQAVHAPAAGRLARAAASAGGDLGPLRGLGRRHDGCLLGRRLLGREPPGRLDVGEGLAGPHGEGHAHGLALVLPVAQDRPDMVHSPDGRGCRHLPRHLQGLTLGGGEVRLDEVHQARPLAHACAVG